MSHTTLVCLPFAGSGASFFRPWRDLAPSALHVVAPQLPGREWRIGEEPAKDVDSAVTALLDDVLDQGVEGRVALFGHSFGGVLAFELARRLLTVGDLELVHLFPSGSPDPWTPRTRRAAGLADEDFLRRVEEFAGYSHEALAAPEMRELILPTLRGDVEMHESYVADTAQPLPVPVTALRGRTDHLVSAAETAGWSRATTAEFTVTEFDGGHMYVTDGAGQLLTLIEHVTAPS
ncbi:thioesterase II family protein [Streptomyces sp. NPDC056373]|uniref:thioesterase II family protein n=1 Tax=Streptomyces sp. NPDC056373 TaxID=3345798 RepID=UPI0035DFE7E8